MAALAYANVLLRCLLILLESVIRGFKSLIRGGKYVRSISLGPATAFGYGPVNLRVAWVDPPGHWTASVIGRNVTDEVNPNQDLPNVSGFGQTSASREPTDRLWESNAGNASSLWQARYAALLMMLGTAADLKDADTMTVRVMTVVASTEAISRRTQAALAAARAAGGR